MASFNVPPNGTAAISMSGTDTLTVAAGAALSVSGSTHTVRFNGTTTGASIGNSGDIANTAIGGRAIRVETSAGSNFTATVTNRNGALIQAVDDAVQIQGGSVTGGTLTLANSGLIVSAFGQALDLAGGTAGFVALVSNTPAAAIWAVANDAVRFGGTSNTLTNSGDLKSAGRGIEHRRGDGHAGGYRQAGGQRLRRYIDWGCGRQYAVALGRGRQSQQSRGNDAASYSTALAGLTVRLDFANLNTGDAASDTLTSIGALIGSGFADSLVGKAASETLRGGSGNDWVIGRQSADLMFSRAGQDYFAFLPEDFQAGVYDVITDFNTGGTLD